MSIEENKAVAGQWLAEFRGRDFPDLSFRATAELIAEGDYGMITAEVGLSATRRHLDLITSA
jgi:hypothetical protein